MLTRLQADTYKVKITFKSHVLSVLFLFYWFLTLHQAMYFKFKKHEIPMSTASQMTEWTECIQTHATLELICSGKQALPHYPSTLDLLSRS